MWFNTLIGHMVLSVNYIYKHTGVALICQLCSFRNNPLNQSALRPTGVTIIPSWLLVTTILTRTQEKPYNPIHYQVIGAFQYQPGGSTFRLVPHHYARVPTGVDPVWHPTTSSQLWFRPSFARAKLLLERIKSFGLKSKTFGHSFSN